MRLKCILAGTVITAVNPPLYKGGVVYFGDKIIAVGTWDDCLELGATVVHKDYNSILLPGLINSHSHLELTGLKAKRGSFTDWLIDVIEKKRNMSGRDFKKGVRDGERELLKNGTTAVVDTVSTQNINKRLLDTVAVYEHLGLTTSVKLLRVRTDISPHAPYSLSDENIKRIASWSKRNPNARLSMHIAESRAETDYFVSGHGPFKAFYNRMGIPARKFARRRPVVHLDKLGLLGPNLLGVHLNDITEKEAALIRRRGMNAAVCPGSLNFFGFPKTGVKRLIQNGVNLMFGTDSMASNKELNMFRELRSAKSYWKLSAQTLLDGATRLPGEFWFSGKCGLLARGATANMLLVSRKGRSSDPYDDLLTGQAETRIIRRILKGRSVK